MNGNVTLDNGTLKASGGTLQINGTVSGAGFLFNGVAPGATASAPAVLAGDLNINADFLRVFSNSSFVLATHLSMAGGTLSADHGITVSPGGSLTGFGTISSALSVAGSVMASGAGLTINGAVQQSSGVINGSRITLGATGSLSGSDNVDSDLYSLAGSVIAPSAVGVAYGNALAANSVNLAGMLNLGAFGVTLRSANADTSPRGSRRGPMPRRACRAFPSWPTAWPTSKGGMPVPQPDRGDTGFT